jgi:hypothetical protein
MILIRSLLLLISLSVFHNLSFSQKKEDSLIIKNDSIQTSRSVDIKTSPADSTTKKKHSPRKAAIRSAILPGWGQTYNRKYWKIPIVYGALGTTAYIVNVNLKQYREIRYAYSSLLDPVNFPKSGVKPYLKSFIDRNASDQLYNIRSEVRQNIDYSVLIFLFIWGLNVVDALVDGHLKDFDVTPELSLKMKPGHNRIKFGL